MSYSRFIDMLSVVFQCLGVVSPAHFVYNFWRKIFLIYFINRSNSIVWFPLRLEILGSMCIAIICCTLCDIKNFEINLSFLFKLFFYITKTSGQKCNYLKNKKSYYHEIKSIFRHFERAFIESNKKNIFRRGGSDFKLPTLKKARSAVNFVLIFIMCQYKALYPFLYN